MTSFGKRLPLGKTLLTGATVLTIGTIGVNAVFLQDGKHPAALFAMRATTSVGTELRADEAALESARSMDRKADSGSVTRIVFDDESTRGTRSAPAETAASPKALLPKPAVRETTTFTRESVAAQAQQQADTDLSTLQDMLARLGYYDGELDGLSGPKTRGAIEAYKADVGLKGIDLTTDELITSARNNLIVTAAIPGSPPAKRPSDVDVTNDETPKYPAAPEPRGNVAGNGIAPLHSTAIVTKVQAGLKSFTMSDMQVDGVFGKETQDAISEFQKLFRLPVTGDIDDDLLKKMDAFGLIQR